MAAFECGRCGVGGAGVEPIDDSPGCSECNGDDDVCQICGEWVGVGYLCTDCDDVVLHRQHNTTDSIDEITYYFGAASGSTRKALRELQEPNVMLNYASKLNKPWWGIDRLFIDSGGYSFMKGMGEYETSDAEYLDFVDEHDPHQFALRDYPCEPDVLDEHGRTVADHQRMTTERHVSLFEQLDELATDAAPVSVIQGWAIDDYVRHVDALRDRGLLTDTVGVGSVCRRNAESDIRRVLLAVRDALPARVDIHAFGVKESVLRHPDVRDAIASADSQSYEMRTQWSVLDDFDAGGKTWRDTALEYLQQRRRIRVAVGGHDDADAEQAGLDGFGE